MFRLVFADLDVFSDKIDPKISKEATEKEIKFLNGFFLPMDHMKAY